MLTKTLSILTIGFVVFAFSQASASSTALAYAECGRYLAAREPVVPTYYTPLPEEFLNVLRKHPIYQMKKDLDAGMGLTFRIQHYSADGLIGPASESFLGETNQADFTFKVLHEVFNQAHFPDQKIHIKEIGHLLDVTLLNGATTPGEVHFVIYDSYVRSESLGKAHLNMPMIKMANPLRPFGYDQKLRGILNLPEHRKIVSVYGTLEITSRHPVHGGEMAEDLIGEADSSIVVLTRQSGHNPVDEEQFKMRLLDKGYTVHYLSHILAGRKLRSYPAIILNDTKGLMPLIYGSADLAVAVGAVNFFEGLLWNVPTVLVKDESAMRGYSTDLFDDMAFLAMRTGGVSMVYSTKDTLLGVDRLSSKDVSEILPYYLIQSQGEKSYAEVYLDRLFQIITSQINQS